MDCMLTTALISFLYFLCFSNIHDILRVPSYFVHDTLKLQSIVCTHYYFMEIGLCYLVYENLPLALYFWALISYLLLYSFWWHFGERFVLIFGDNGDYKQI